jgi:uncharacterized protein YkwD
LKDKKLLIVPLLLLFILANCSPSPAPEETPTPTQADSLMEETSPPTDIPAPTLEPAQEIVASPTSGTAPTEPQPTSPPPTEEPTETATAAPTEEASPTATPVATQEATQPTPTPETPPTEPPASACVEKAAFFEDITVPDGTFFEQGATFTKTWRFRNEGTCTWTTDYTLVFHSGKIMNAPLSVPFTSSAAPGEMIDLSVEMVAPARGGNHQGNWEFENPSGQHFGTGSAGTDFFWVQIDVRFLDQNDQPQPDPITGPPPPTPAGCEAQRDPGFESQVLALINQARTANGLNPFTLNGQLSAAATAHSTDMACNNFIDHNGSNGSTWYDRISAQGYVYSAASENIYVGNPQFGGTPQGAFDWWMNSQVHRDNILNPNMSEIGVGYIFNPNSDFGGYYTLNFARP